MGTVAILTFVATFDQTFIVLAFHYVYRARVITYVSAESRARKRLTPKPPSVKALKRRESFTKCSASLSHCCARSLVSLKLRWRFTLRIPVPLESRALVHRNVNRVGGWSRRTWVLLAVAVNAVYTTTFVAVCGLFYSPTEYSRLDEFLSRSWTDCGSNLVNPDRW